MPLHLALVALLVGLLLPGCASLPKEVERTESIALPDTADTPLGRAIAGEVAAHPGRSGLHALGVGEDAFAARVVLARAAQRSLDLQYYIWHADTTGALMPTPPGRRPSAACACACCSTTTTPGLDEPAPRRCASQHRGALFNPRQPACGFDSCTSPR
jgi:hypothetical protein